MSKLVIIPRQNLQITDTHTHKLRLSIGTMSVMADTEPHTSATMMVHDPVEPILRYYLPNEAFASWGMRESISYSIPSGWDFEMRRDVAAWADEHCDTPILWCEDNNTLVFCDGLVRRSQFVSWAATRRLRPEHFTITADDLDMMLEIETWLIDHVGQGNYTSFAGNRKTHVMIRDENAAVEFKLRWCEDEMVHKRELVEDDVPF
jgi:hypothetical protein